MKKPVMSMCKNVIRTVLKENSGCHEQIITESTHLSPKVYNIDGEPMYFFYLQDEVCSHTPYSFSSPAYSVTRNIIWDRYNRALPIHFYSHDRIFHPVEEAKKKFGLLIESEAIVPSDYDNVLKKTGHVREFDAIFTHSYRILEKYENAKFMPGGGVWFGSKLGGGIWDENAIQKKTKNISVVSSDKAMCDLHEYRKALALHYKNSTLVDTFGTFDGGQNVKIADSLSDYRYSIVIENYVSPYYFTEKIMNCFASMTIPIYIGATDIGSFFNRDGIIRISPMDFAELDKKLSQCGKEDYENRIEAIKDNYERVKAYVCYEDYLFNRYSDFILK